MWNIKKNKDKSQPRKLTKAARSFILSGDDVLDYTRILQAIRPAQDRTAEHIAGLKEYLKQFRDDGGTIKRDDTERGYDVVFTFATMTIRKHFLPDDTADGMTLDDTGSDELDTAALQRLTTAVSAARELPKLQFAADELDRLVSYIENDNALQGLQHLKDLAGNDLQIVYEAATAAEDDGEAVDYSKFFEPRRSDPAPKEGGQT